MSGKFFGLNLDRENRILFSEYRQSASSWGFCGLKSLEIFLGVDLWSFASRLVAVSPEIKWRDYLITLIASALA